MNQNENMTQVKGKCRRGGLLITIGIIVAAVAICLFVFEIPGLWAQMLAIISSAFLGCGATVYLTNSLLERQKEADIEKDKKTEQYKHKIKIYQTFLEKLYDVVKDRDLTTEEKINMQFQTAILSMHTNSKHIELISENVGRVINCLCTPSKKYQVQDLQESLFVIVRQLREELYEGQITDDENSLKNTLNNFVEAYKGIEGSDGNNVDDGIELKIPIWQQATEHWLKNGRWKLLIDGETICLHRSNNRNIHVQFGFWRGHYYIQATYDPFSNFSQTLKWEYGGSRTYSTWWNHISTREYYDLNEGEFWHRFNESESMQNELVAWFNDLIAFIEKWDEPAERWFTLKKMIDVEEYRKQGWEFWVYHKNLANVCDSHLKEEGEPFIDTFSENGKIIIRLGNRTNKADRQKDILRKLNLPTDNVIEDEDRTDYAVFDEGTPNDVVMSKVAELIEKLSKI